MRVGVNTFIVREVSGRGFPIDELEVDFVELGFDDRQILTDDGINWGEVRELPGLGVEFTVHAPTSDGRNVRLDLGRYSRVNVVTMKRVIKIASALNSEVVVVHGGDIGTSYHRAFANTKRQLMEISAIAEDHGVKLLIENLTGNRVGTFLHELLPFLEENVETCLDIGHAFLTAMSYGIPMDEFALLKADEVHAHDNNGEWDEHLPPEEGMIGRDYTARLVKAAEPDYLTLEIRRFSRPESVFNAIAFAKSLRKAQIREAVQCGTPSK